MKFCHACHPEAPFTSDIRTQGSKKISKWSILERITDLIVSSKPLNHEGIVRCFWYWGDTQSIFSSEAWIDSDVLLADIGFEMFWIGLAHIFVRIVWRESWYKKAFIFILYYHICNVLPESIPSRFWCLWAGAGGAHLERQEGHVWDSLKHRKIVASFFAMPK